ncbi:hypothetical protein [Conexibacter sp. CPCC 206217]|uniref:hypothetical protein n=1 Tax=Conexibacter sp. CPCC 206217 TaxID=3064574 RepID=UPI00272169C1|nr:hypothetical protein [Conexibacter sp. CPCC 206217]MDO8209694.1 hypothetical protein [Conexibacter sp. CPCC 206217]
MAADAGPACAQCRGKSSSLFLAGSQRRSGERTEGSAMSGADLVRLLASRGELHSK